MVGAYSLDERTGPTLEPILHRIDELDDDVLVLYGHTPKPNGVTPETIEAVFARAREDGVDILTFADLAKGTEKRSGIVVSFDDTEIDDWYAMRDIYKRYDAHATFFVTKYPEWTDDGRAKLHTLFAEGHSIEAHSMTHPFICPYVAAYGLDAYITNEVMPSMAVLQADGFTPVAYAFPGGSMGNAIVDDLAPMIPITRGITYLPR
jgi:peptidoglycan/xylan/chitin deacetylase (PgdA/CDA1 family)